MKMPIRTLLALCIIMVFPAGQSWSGSWQEVYADKATSVVLVLGMNKGRGQNGSSGTGSIIDRRGTVLTNAHVVTDSKEKTPYSKLRVFLKPDRIIGKPENDLTKQYSAELLAINPNYDLALLRIVDPPDNLAVMELGDPNQVAIGENVAAIGHPEQGGLWSLTTGVVSAEFEDFQNREGWNLFQTDASLNRGNSGGPLVNHLGNLVGVNVLVARMAKDGFVITDINFSIKSTVVQKWVSEQGIKLPFSAILDKSKKHQEGNLKPTIQESTQKEPRQKSQPHIPMTKVKTSGPELITEPHPYKEKEVLEWYVRVEQDLEKDADDMRSLIDRYRRK